MFRILLLNNKSVPGHKLFLIARNAIYHVFSIMPGIAAVLDMVSFVELSVVGYNAVYSVKSQPTVRGNMSPPSSGSKKRPSKKPA
jgi:hypothetical protein